MAYRGNWLRMQNAEYMLSLKIEDTVTGVRKALAMKGELSKMGENGYHYANKILIERIFQNCILKKLKNGF